MTSVKDIRSYFTFSDNSNKEQIIKSKKSISEEPQIYLPKCNICGLKFLCEESLDRHKSKPHFGTTYSGKIGKYQCDFDGKFFTEKSNIYEHMKEVHRKFGDYKCQICHSAFKTRRKLKCHENSHDKKFKCLICLKKFTRAINVRHHQMKSHENQVK
ncbi:hypothetical protein ACKWTF_015265 [Chironomus riparius]